jgi:hypothetical protein
MKSALLPLLLLAGCAASRPAPDVAESVPPAVASGPAQTHGVSQERVTGAATAPLNDLNLIRSKIPEVLVAASKSPYAVPATRSCEALLAEVGELDAALGADLDTPPSADKPSLLERGGDMAGDAAIGALRRTTESLIPFRGWVRKLTGAERHSKAVAAAITAGGIRRAYLKGLGQSLQCPPPAAPLPPPPAPAEPAKAES